jgi:hypothetical protein
MRNSAWPRIATAVHQARFDEAGDTVGRMITGVSVIRLLMQSRTCMWV